MLEAWVHSPALLLPAFREEIGFFGAAQILADLLDAAEGTGRRGRRAALSTGRAATGAAGWAVAATRRIIGTTLAARRIVAAILATASTARAAAISAPTTATATATTAATAISTAAILRGGGFDRELADHIRCQGDRSEGNGESDRREHPQRSSANHKPRHRFLPPSARLRSILI